MNGLTRACALLAAAVSILLTGAIAHANDAEGTLRTKMSWYGGASGDDPARVEGETLTEISVRAGQEAAFSGRIVEYRSENGKIVHRTYPEYGKSKCRMIHERAWQEAKIILDRIKEVCIADYNKYYTQRPFAPRIPGVPFRRR